MNSILSYLTFTIPSLLFKQLYFLSLSFFLSFLYPFLSLSHSSLRRCHRRAESTGQNRRAELTGQNRPSTASDSSTVVDVQFRPEEVLSTSFGSSTVGSSGSSTVDSVSVHLVHRQSVQFRPAEIDAATG
jgi:hypothetical protein